MRPFIGVLGVAGLLTMGAFGASPAQEPSLEYRVKAAFLLNFTRFIEWPPAAFPDEKSPLSICIVGDDPFGTVVDEVVNGEAVGQRRLAVRRIRQSPAPGACQVLFFEKLDKEVRGILAGAGPGVLTVGEGEDFIHEGGAIAFVLENRRVRFNVNRTAATRAELNMNAKLLSVARLVEN